MLELEERIMAELKQIPDYKLAEIYDLIHYFRLGLVIQENQLSVSQKLERQASSLLQLGVAQNKTNNILENSHDPLDDLMWIP